ncbi:hypothetical protein IHV09_09470 [Fictibacillus sp. 23RED33]|jgi:N-acetylmuramoyl-L-alanine amidase|uniref:SH3 domain-containing protein n=1 Tax=Fictibacillus sp. 23RED33 TaxID=2745879 RepID=UPI0018CEC286|nr:SH3 domain-containing protein [Fictibacillus sp. 23RED33]MBH0173787.1 hypothetical protein [Fictibacillus sp. 23RED33]
MKKLVFACACLLFTLFFYNSSQQVSAEDSLKYKNLVTTVDNVEVKWGASSNYHTVFTMNKGTRVHVRDTFVGTDGQKWISLATHRNKSGWAKVDQFKVPGPEAGRKALITNDVEIRRGADFGYAPVATLLKGSVATQVDAHMTYFGDMWYKVDNGKKQGWLENEFFQNYMDYYGVGTVTAENGTIRRGASTDYTVRTTLVKGKRVDTFVKFINSRGEAWYLVQTPKNEGGWQGWIKANEVSVKTF